MRHQAREIALQILFQTEFTSRIPLQDFLALFEETVPKESVEYAEKLVVGVQNNLTQIDEFIQSCSNHWKLNRMSTVDRNILRISVFEMKFSSEIIKVNIAINEAIEIAKKYGSSDSASFVNGILDAVAKDLTRG
jgi:N utilization substance protein B